MNADATPVDVLIPVFNGARWVVEAVQSIQRQTHRALQIHVVDDGSTDATPALLAALAAGDTRVHIHSQRNGGIVNALTFGLRFCQADFVARHDADDLAHPQRLAVQLAYLQANAGCVAVGALARHIDGQGRLLGTVTQLRAPQEADATWLPAREPYLMHPLLLVRRQALHDAGGYRHVVHAEDSDLYWRLRVLGTLHNLPQVLADYRVHGASISSASLHNGRLMAVSAQLAALSARRRQQGMADIVFDAAFAARLRQATTLHGLLGLASDSLGVAEQQWLLPAVAAKLLELAAYQPFEPDADDCQLIGQALAGPARAQATPANRRALVRMATRAAVRLCAAGRVRDALRLVGPGGPAQWLPFAGRCALHAALPARLRHGLHGLRQRLRTA